MITIEDIKYPVREAFEQYEQAFTAAMHSENAHLNEVLDYIHAKAGKQLRHMIVLLAAQLCRGVTEKTIQTAVALELLHNASLVHDDVVDSSPMRRGAKSVQAKWSNKVAVLVGDYMLAGSEGGGISVDTKTLGVPELASNCFQEHERFRAEGEIGVQRHCGGHRTAQHRRALRIVRVLPAVAVLVAGAREDAKVFYALELWLVHHFADDCILAFAEPRRIKPSVVIGVIEREHETVRTAQDAAKALLCGGNGRGIKIVRIDGMLLPGGKIRHHKELLAILRLKVLAELRIEPEVRLPAGRITREDDLAAHPKHVGHLERHLRSIKAQLDRLRVAELIRQLGQHLHLAARHHRPVDDVVASGLRETGRKAVHLAQPHGLDGLEPCGRVEEVSVVRSLKGRVLMKWPLVPAMDEVVALRAVLHLRAGKYRHWMRQDGRYRRQRKEHG